MSDSTNSTGKSGESRACTHMLSLGFRIRETNWRHRKDEVDIIVENEEFIVFVEVKTRQNNSYGNPEDFVTKKKQRFMIRAANAYIDAYNIEKEVRFDIIAITLDAGENALEYIPNAFYPIVK